MSASKLALLPFLAAACLGAAHADHRTLLSDKPAQNWSSECYPIGNGRLGAMDFGGVAKQVVQFNEVSLWGGANNWDGGYDMKDTGFGGYRNFGEFTIELAGIDPKAPAPADYRRELDVGNGIHHTAFTDAGVKYTREAFASRPAQAMVFRYTADKPGKLSGKLRLRSAQKNTPTAVDIKGLRFEGALANKLRFAADLRVIPSGGAIRTEGDALVFENCDALTLVLGARTDYKPDYKSDWRTGVAPTTVLSAELDTAVATPLDTLRAAHTADLEKLLARATIDIGSTPDDIAKLPTAERKKRYAAGGLDPDLEEMLFRYGRYLLASSSRPGGLPANLQGLWNNSNTPPWAADYHNNINVQMNYWAAETTNLSECHRPLIDFIVAQSEACRIATRKAFGKNTRGWTARTSQGIFGGNGWEWNIPASAWYATHVFEHWAFTQDREYLVNTAYPLLKEICEMWEDRLKPLGADGANFHTPDKKANLAELKGIKAGTLVVPDGWSPEHGPREDGVMHDQQLIRELFEDYLIAASALGVDADYRKKVADMQSRLLPNKIGKWGQLQEWAFDRDNPDDQHRHTSHLFAVYPGRQISREKTPALAAAATLSLRSRSGNYGKNKDTPFTVDSTVGDSRQSWAWPWRCAMWARLGEGEKSAIMVRGLLTHNTGDNLFAIASNVFQMDGNFGIPAAMTEMLLQSHAGEIALLPAIPAAWAKSGSFTGLRARGGHTVDCTWKDGKVTEFHIRSGTPTTVRVRVNGALRTVTTEAQPK